MGLPGLFRREHPAAGDDGKLPGPPDPPAENAPPPCGHEGCGPVRCEWI